jgi:hypothetical protein
MLKRWIPVGLALSLAAVLASCTPTEHGATTVPGNLSPSKQSAPSGPVSCLDQRLRVPLPSGGWLPDRGGILEYNPDSSSGPELAPSANAARMAATFATVVGKGFQVAKFGENGIAKCALVRWALLRDHVGSSVYLALLQLRDPINSGSFPLIGTIDRRQLDGGTEVLTSQTEDMGVVTVVEARSHGLVALIQVRRSNDGEGEGYPTTVVTAPPSGSDPTGPAPLAIDQAISAATKMLSDLPSRS